MKIYVVLYGHDASFEGAFLTKDEAQEFIDKKFPNEDCPFISEYEMGTSYIECALDRIIRRRVKK